MPESEYEARKDSVLAWKKTQKLGRFDPNAPDVEQQKIRQLERDVEERGMFDVHEERRVLNFILYSTILQWQLSFSTLTLLRSFTVSV
jgi:hypothetical protein